MEKPIQALTLVLSLALLPFTVFAQNSQLPTYNGHAYKAGELIVKLKSGDTNTKTLQSFSSSAPSFDHWPVRVLAHKQLGSQKSTDNAKKTLLSLSSKTNTLANLFKISIDQTEDMATAIEQLSQQPDVEYVEPNYVYTLLETPNDPQYDDQWWLNNAGQTGGTPGVDIGIEEAWEIETGSKEIIVAVIDSGVAYNHEDLNDNMWINPGEIAGNGKDDDGNGYIDDIYGWDFYLDNNDPNAGSEHGTHVAGIIGAKCTNNTGVCGVNQSVSIMALKAETDTGHIDVAGSIQAITYAVDNGARVINASWGGGGTSDSMQERIQYAQDNEVLFIAAAGNDGYDNDTYSFFNPSNYPSSYDIENIIAVAATDHNDSLASFSNYGATSVDLAAPGVEILSTIPGDQYAAYGGTSMATPVVAGVAALLFAQDPSRTAAEVKQLIMDHVDPVDELSGKMVAGGRINAYESLNSNRKPEIIIDYELNDFALAIDGTIIDPEESGGIESAELRITGTLTNYSRTISITPSGTGYYSKNINLPSDEGDLYNVTVTATDIDGFSGEETIQFVAGDIPNTPPTINLSSVSSDRYSCINASGSASDSDIIGEVSSVDVIIIGDGSYPATLESNGNWSFEKCGFIAGTYQIQAQSTDNFTEKSLKSAIKTVDIAAAEAVTATLPEHVSAERVQQFGMGFWYAIPETEQYKALKNKYCSSTMFWPFFNCDGEEHEFTLYNCGDSDGWTDDVNTCQMTTPETDIALSGTDRLEISLGDSASYSLTVTNSGDNPASAVNIKTERMYLDCAQDMDCGGPDGDITITDVQTSQGSCNIEDNLLACSFGNLAAGESATISATIEATRSGYVYLNFQSDSAQTDTDSSNNSLTLDIFIDSGTSSDDGGADGDDDGSSDGDIDGGADGASDGDQDGSSDGDFDGGSDGDQDGSSDGDFDGGSDGDQDSSSDGDFDGGADGSSDGDDDIIVEDGDDDTDGDIDGGSDGDDDITDGDTDGGSDGVEDGCSDGDTDETIDTSEGNGGIGGTGATGSTAPALLLMIPLAGLLRRRKK